MFVHVCPRICHGIYIGIYIGIYFGIFTGIYPEICHAEKNIKKIMVSGNFRQTHLQEVGLTKIMGDHAPLSIMCHVGLHVEFSSMNVFLGL
jgi:hypothetical protein